MDNLRADQVFGISNTILPESYIDRGNLDESLKSLLRKSKHIALRGESKSGKSWLRQQMLPDAIVVQCRLEKKTTDIYVDILSQLGIKLEIESNIGTKISGKISAVAEFGSSLLAKCGLKAAIEDESSGDKTFRTVGHDVNDLNFVAKIIIQSGRRIVIEDFHYLSMAERKYFAFDLKALWDYGLFLVIIGIWSQNNMLLALNSDLSNRVEELSISWQPNDLEKVLEKGSKALNLTFATDYIRRAVADSFGNVGILQTLAIKSLEYLNIIAREQETTRLIHLNALEAAALDYAEQLESMYQTFASNVAKGIRKQKVATGIYAHAMSAIIEASDEDLIRGLSRDKIFSISSARQPRIQKGNLHSVLCKFDSLQVDDAGRNLVITYNPSTKNVTIVDKQLLFYRKYCTATWPWEDMIQEVVDHEGAFDADN